MIYSSPFYLWFRQSFCRLESSRLAGSWGSVTVHCAYLSSVNLCRLLTSAGTRLALFGGLARPWRAVCQVSLEVPIEISSSFGFLLVLWTPAWRNINITHIYSTDILICCDGQETSIIGLPMIFLFFGCNEPWRSPRGVLRPPVRVEELAMAAADAIEALHTACDFHVKLLKLLRFILHYKQTSLWEVAATRYR